MCDGNRPRASGRTRAEQHPKQRSSMGASVPNHWQDGGNHAERFGERSGAADIPGKQPAAQRFNLCFERNPQRESLSGARHKTALQGIGSWRIASEQNRDIPQLVGDARSCGKEWRTLPCGSRHREQGEGWRHLLGEMLENGTGKMKPRPYKQKVIDRALPKIKEIYKKPF